MNRVARLLAKVGRHRLRKVLYAALLRALGHSRRLRILRGLYLEEVNPAFLDVPQGYAAGFVPGRALEGFTPDPRAELSPQFARDALTKADKCYGFVHGGALAAYTWYATNATPISPELRLHFDRGYVYLYKGFTRHSHRGKRLYPIGISRALRHYRSIGYKGMLAYVEATNLDSLKSCARIGFRSFGSLYILRLRGRYLVFSSRGCARFGFRLERYSARMPASFTTRPHFS